MPLYRKLIEYTNKDGVRASIGGLMEPGVIADTQAHAAMIALESAPSFVRENALSVQVKRDDGPEHTTAARTFEPETVEQMIKARDTVASFFGRPAALERAQEEADKAREG